MPAATNTFSFGTGQAICLAGGVATQIGTLQEISLDISSTNVMLYGQNQFPDAVARGEGKIQGKAKTGRLDLQLFASAYLGLPLDTTGYTKTLTETKTVPATSTYTAAVANTNITDLGVFYADGTGQLTPAVSASAGKYSVNLTTGVYTFAAADASKTVLITYSYKATTGAQIAMNNLPMGQNPVFALQLQNGYANINGYTYTSIYLKSCVVSKISLPFKNKDFVVSDLDFDVFSDPVGGLLTYGLGT